jgi:hypothetical protein
MVLNLISEGRSLDTFSLPPILIPDRRNRVFVRLREVICGGGTKPRLKPRLTACQPASQSQSRPQSVTFGLAWLDKPRLWLDGLTASSQATEHGTTILVPDTCRNELSGLGSIVYYLPHPPSSIASGHVNAECLPDSRFLNSLLVSFHNFLG